ncbi:hypothetical protein ACOSQ4_011892 [Xanthoceras sorbifolium]
MGTTRCPIKGKKGKRPTTARHVIILMSPMIPSIGHVTTDSNLIRKPLRHVAAAEGDNYSPRPYSLYSGTPWTFSCLRSLSATVHVAGVFGIHNVV